MTHLKEGDLAPEISVYGNEDAPSLQSLRGKKVILYFYPKDNTPGCSAEACNLRDNYSFWQSQGYEIIGVSPDSESSHQKFAGKYDLPFKLIADTERKILELYGVWCEKNMCGKKSMGVLRSTFIIDEEGKIIKIFTKVKTKEHSQQIQKELLG